MEVQRQVRKEDSILYKKVIELACTRSGFHTQVVRFPFENFGVAVLTNDDAYGDQFMEVIKWRLIDALLGLEPIDWDSRCEI